MKKGDVFTGKVTELIFPNKGIVEIGDERVIVKNTLPGQTVSFILRKNKTGLKEGQLLKILEPSAIETAEKCSICTAHDRCGGCSYQTVPYEKQLGIKMDQVKRLLDNCLKNHEGAFEPEWFEGIKGSPCTSGYRNKMEYSFGDEYIGGPMTLGMHISGHYNDVVDIPDCNIADADFRSIRSYTLSHFTDRGLRFYRRADGQGYLRHLLVRKGLRTGQILVDIVTSSQDDAELSSYVDGLLQLKLEGGIAGIMNTVNSSTGDAVSDEETRLLWGQDHFYEELLGLKFKITPFSFFQTNTAGAEVLYETARDYIHASMDGALGTVFDLYSGTGTIAQMMASEAAAVVGIEIVPEAVEAAKINAGLNGLHNCEFLAGDVRKCLDDVEEKPDLIIMDPPRDGAAPKALAKILDYGVQNIIYVSCKPTSLARDLHIILESGYVLKRGVCVDMFPMTANVETVVLLSR